MAEQRILLFTKTTGYRHDALPQGVSLIQEFAAANSVEVEHTEDATAFTSDNLARFGAVVWLQVSGDVLNDDQRTALDGYLANGGGWAGIHGAADAEWSWPAYEAIAGARFLYHPSGQFQRQEALVVAERKSPATEPIPDGWRWAEEWYAFTRNPRSGFEILLRIDEGTYDPREQPMGTDHPVSWRGTYGTGRTFYTALGHYTDNYDDDIFRHHIWGGIASVMTV